MEQADVSQYLDAKFALGSLPSGLSNLIYQHSGGNPLFMVAIVQDLLKDGSITQEQGRWTLTRPLQTIDPAVPDTLQQMIESQFEMLSMPEQRLLKAFELSAFSKALFIEGLRKRFPDAAPDEFQRILLARLEKCHNRNY